MRPLLRRTRLDLFALGIAGGLVAVAAAPTAGQTTTVGLEGGFVDARDFTGATAVGFLEARSLVFFARGAADVGFGRGDSKVEKQGDTCRDVDSGDAVNDSRCTTVDGGVTIKAGVRFPIADKHLQLGLGYRLAKSHSGGLGSASLRWPRPNGWWGFTLEAGSDLVRGTVGIGWDRGGER